MIQSCVSFGLLPPLPVATKEAGDAKPVTLELAGFQLPLEGVSQSTRETDGLRYGILRFYFKRGVDIQSAVSAFMISAMNAISGGNRGNVVGWHFYHYADSSALDEGLLLPPRIFSPELHRTILAPLPDYTSEARKAISQLIQGLTPGCQNFRPDYLVLDGPNMGDWACGGPYRRFKIHVRWDMDEKDRPIVEVEIKEPISRGA